MAESVYRFVDLVGVSSESWEKATEAAVKTAAQSLRDLRIAEVLEQDAQIEGDKVIGFRVKLRLSFKYEG